MNPAEETAPCVDGLATGGGAVGLAADPMNDDRLALLEERLAWLQRHAAEQDKAMLEQAAEIDRLKRQVVELREKIANETSSPPGAAEERPPHY